MTAREDKIALVMREFRKGTLKSSSGVKVRSSAQAKAIAISEGNRVMKKRRKA